MAQVGDALRAARESRGLTLEQVEKTTRIRRALLQALEEDRFDQLPAPVYARAFIRSYARLVGLDPEELVAAYATATGAPTRGRAAQVLDEPLVQSVAGSPVAGILRGIVIVLAIAAAGWYAYVRFYLGETPTLPTLPILAPRGMAPGETPAPSTVAPKAAVVTPAPTIAVEPTAQPLHPTPSPEPTATAALPQHTREPSGVVIITPTPMATATFTPVAGVVVEATFTAATYVEVTADGVRLLTATLQAGDVRTWQGDRAVALRVGNAGGITLRVNGVEVPPLGIAGQVVNVEYTIDNLPQG